MCCLVSAGKYPINKSVGPTFTLVERQSILSICLAEKSTANPNQKRNSNEVVKLDGLGLALSEATKSLRKKFSIEKAVKGAIVVGAVPDGIAARMGVRIGDVIVEVDQNTITRPSEVVTIIGNVLKQGKKKSVLFTINRQGSIRFIGLKLK